MIDLMTVDEISTMLIHALHFHYRIMQMDFLIHPMDPVASKQNRSQKFNRTAPSM